MKLKRLIIALSILLFTAGAALAQTEKPDSNVEPMETIVLERMEVLGESQELALRVLKIGFENKRSSRLEDAEKIVCSIRERTGSHLNYVYCGKNWALDSMNRMYRRLFTIGVRGILLPGTKDNLYASRQFISPGFLKSVLEQLGPSELNREIVARANKGEPLPDYVPSEAALGRFIEAYTQVKAIRAQYDSRLAELSGDARQRLQAKADAAMIAAIEEAGLELESYNKISTMSEEYASLQNYLAKRLAAR